MEDNCSQECNVVFNAFKQFINFIRGGLLARGIIFSLLGLMMLFSPAMTMGAITIAIGIFILIDGIGMLMASLRGEGKAKGWSLTGAVFLIVLGLFACFSPLMLNMLWIILLGAWLFYSGIQCLLFVRRTPGASMFSGLLSLLSGLILMISPIIGLVTISWLLGLLLFISGISAIVIASRLKKCNL